MNVVEVDTPGGSYPIHIGPGRLDRLDQCIPADATAIAVVTNPTVAALYGDRAEAALARTGKRVLRIELPDGESYKDWQSLNLIFDALLSQRLDRRCMLVALGGGVIGDMTGFAAAVYMRGVRFLQVPTTLLAQVDSSVGGKTAVNHPLGKNMIGAFYQPVAVEIDTDVLNTLPAREVSAGLAEVIKYGLILDPEFWAWCELNAPKLRALDPDAVTYAIRRSCELKAQVVGKDERESGLRAILNLGHTFGHAIEAGSLRRLAARRGRGLRHGAGGRAVGRCGGLCARRRRARARAGRRHRLPGHRARPGRRPLAGPDAGRQENRGRLDPLRAHDPHRRGRDPRGARRGGARRIGPDHRLDRQP